MAVRGNLEAIHSKTKQNPKSVFFFLLQCLHTTKTQVTIAKVMI